jgi:DNA-binding transcriptional MerR regulator
VQEDAAMPYRIGEFADLSGVSAKTLRFYDEIGLLRPASVDSRTRYRFYLPEQLQDLATILSLRELGISLADIRSLRVKAGSRKRLRQVLNELKQNVERSIQSAHESLHWIEATLNEVDASRRLVPVVLKRRPAIPIASVRATLRTYSDVSRFEQELLMALPPESIAPTRGVLWHRCADSGSLEGEPFVMLQRRVPQRSSYDLKMLPQATLACAYCGLDDESAEQAYDALGKWTSIRGYRLDGPKREMYLNGILEIQFPVTTYPQVSM